VNVLWIFVSCLWSDQFDFMALFMVLNFWIGLFFNVPIANFLYYPWTRSVLRYIY